MNDFDYDCCSAVSGINDLSEKVWRILENIRQADEKIGSLFPERYNPIINNNKVSSAILKIYLGSLNKLYYRLAKEAGSLTQTEKERLSYEINSVYMKWQQRLPYEDKKDFDLVHYNLTQVRL